MRIELHEIPVREVAAGYNDSAENGVTGYGGRLNIRPAFQREFIYKDKQRNEVLNTIVKNFPLNVMYWAKSSDESFEVLDGQQRTISICQYINGDYSINHRAFGNLTDTEQQQILDYKLMIYICEGNDREKLDWFKIINIAGEQLTEQELRNAIYTGTWLTDAKRFFSKTNCVAYQLGCKYLNGVAIRQDYLQSVIEWIATPDEHSIEDYMALHQHDTNATALWLYFQAVINWTQAIFPLYRKEMKGLKWGLLYNKYHEMTLDPYALEEKIKTLMQDDDVQKKSGIYEYLLSADERKLDIRKFTDAQKRAAYERQNGTCCICNEHFEIEEMEGDHITPWARGGATVPENLQMLCRDCNRRKSDT